MAWAVPDDEPFVEDLGDGPVRDVEHLSNLREGLLLYVASAHDHLQLEINEDRILDFLQWSRNPLSLHVPDVHLLVDPLWLKEEADPDAFFEHIVVALKEGAWAIEVVAEVLGPLIPVDVVVDPG